MSIVSYDLLGAAHPKFPLVQALNLLPAGSGVGWFWREFGNSEHVFKRVAESMKFPAIRIQDDWDGPHPRALVPVKTLVTDCKAIRKLANQYPHVSVYISHSCEHASTNKREIKKRMNIIRDHGFIPVNSVYTGSILKGEINEKHGAKGKVKGKYITSFDGENCMDADINGWHEMHQNSLMRFLWGARFNGREKYEDENGNPAPPPPINQRTAWPDAGYIKMIVALSEPSGPAPTVPGTIPLKKPNLYKLAADDHEGYAVRENKPVMIMTDKAVTVNVLTITGKKIFELPWESAYRGGGHRYYSFSRYGWEIAELAKQESGSPWTLLDLKGKIYGPIQPSYRWGYFR